MDKNVQQKDNWNKSTDDDSITSDYEPGHKRSKADLENDVRVLKFEKSKLKEQMKNYESMMVTSALVPKLQQESETLLSNLRDANAVFSKISFVCTSCKKTFKKPNAAVPVSFLNIKQTSHQIKKEVIEAIDHADHEELPALWKTPDAREESISESEDAGPSKQEPTAHSIVYPEDVSSVNERAAEIVSSPTIDTKITTPAEVIRSEEVADEGIMVDLGHGVKIHNTVLQSCSMTDVSKLTNDLLRALFDVADFAKCSCSGKKGKKKSDEDKKPPLDKNKIDAITDYVKKRFSQQSQASGNIEKQVKTIIQNKCKNVSKTYKKITT